MLSHILARAEGGVRAATPAKASARFYEAASAALDYVCFACSALLGGGDRARAAARRLA
ncbi:MAG TPA: hypothetical protein VI168_00020 [Croceibacterium sp.]